MSRIPRLLPLAAVAVAGVLAINMMSGARDLPGLFQGARAWAEELIPIYPATSTVASWQVQRSMAVVLDTLQELDDPVPE